MLIVDIVTDWAEIGTTKSIVHCETDWKTMTVLRAVPYGPLSPF